MTLLRRLFSKNPSRIDAAKSEIDAARSRLKGTIGELQSRLKPANLAKQALDETRTRTISIAQGAGQAIRKRPAAVAAGVAAIGLIVAAKPLFRLARRLRDKPEETQGPDHQFKA